MADESDNSVSESPQRTALNFDWREHTDLVEDDEISDEAAREFLETLWSIMVHFAQMGFDLNPVQLLCEQIDETPQKNDDPVLNFQDLHQQSQLTRVSPDLSAEAKKEDS